jgi:hypothetical protein
VDGEVETDRVFKLSSAAVGSAPDLLFGESCEPALDLVDPRRVGGREMDLESSNKAPFRRVTTVVARGSFAGLLAAVVLPWVDTIMDGFDLGKISGKALIKTSTKVDKETAVEIVAKIDRKIKRTGDRYADEELSREEYRDLVAKLRRQKDAYIAIAAEEPDPKDLSTLSSAWKTGDAAQRWEVLNALFERIHVRQDRKVEGYTPRMDRAKKVRMLISTAFASYYDWPEPEPEDGPGAAVANRLRRGGAGILLLSWRACRLIA